MLGLEEILAQGVLEVQKRIECSFVVLSETVKVSVLKFGMRVTFGIKRLEMVAFKSKGTKNKRMWSHNSENWHVKEVRLVVWSSN